MADKWAKPFSKVLPDFCSMLFTLLILIKDDELISFIVNVYVNDSGPFLAASPQSSWEAEVEQHKWDVFFLWPVQLLEGFRNNALAIL